MRTIQLLLLAFLLGVTGCQSTPDASHADDAAQRMSAVSTLTVMSFNIRNGRANDGDNRWPNRRRLVAEVMSHHDADIVGLQEAFRFQLDDLADRLPGYAEIGEGRDGGTADEYSAILYRTDRFEALASGTFWLSETPEVVSKHWKHYHHRICTWARFKDRDTNNAFYIFNTHFDHQSQLARVNSSKLIAQRIADREHRDPVILTGDLNAGEDNPAVRYLKGLSTDASTTGPATPPRVRLVDTFRVLHPDAQDVGTGNSGYTGRIDGAKIDYVMVGPGIETLSASIDQAPRNGRYPSDHYPVLAKVRLMPTRPKITDKELQRLERQAH
jgi:endonuclease/exonuclease/phosphatase family metal-dependent hydrolase